MRVKLGMAFMRGLRPGSDEEGLRGSRRVACVCSRVGGDGHVHPYIIFFPLIHILLHANGFSHLTLEEWTEDIFLELGASNHTGLELVPEHLHIVVFVVHVIELLEIIEVGKLVLILVLKTKRPVDQLQDLSGCDKFIVSSKAHLLHAV